MRLIQQVASQSQFIKIYGARLTKNGKSWSWTLNLRIGRMKKMDKLANGMGWVIIMIMNFICGFSVNKQNYSDMNFIIVEISFGMAIINIIEYINERRR